MRKIVALLLAFTLMLGMLPTTTSHAATTNWTKISDGYYMLDGTDITVEMSGTTMTVSGNGAIPDYEIRTLSQRPWHKSECTTLIIDSGITYIGTYAFASLTQLKNITMSSTTFIAAKNSFTGISYEPIYRIKGYQAATTYYGTIPYTSLDSLRAFAFSHNDSDRACFLFDHTYMVEDFQNSTNPTIANVYCVYDSTEPWEDVGENGNGNVDTEVCKLASTVNDGYFEVETTIVPADTTYYELFSNLIGNYTFATNFTMEILLNGNTTMSKTIEPLCYTLTIPDEYVQAGRVFKVINAATGSTEILDDLDLDDHTVTFATKTPTSTFALVYE